MKATPEGALLKQCVSILDIFKAQRKLAWRRINVSPIIRGGGREKLRFAPNPMKGMADLQLWLLDGPQLCVELKAPGGSLSKNQRVFRADIQGVGHAYYVIKAVEEFISILEHYGLFLPKNSYVR